MRLRLTPRKDIYAERFHQKYEPEPNTGCWLWTGAASLPLPGYGVMRWKNGGYERTHRISYELHYGPIPEGLWILHKCDTRLCVNPKHLYAGTPAENNADTSRRDRKAKNPKSNPRKGEENRQSKLTESQVRAIYQSKALNQRAADVANRHRISISQVYAIRQGRTWRHLKLSNRE